MLNMFPLMYTSPGPREKTVLLGIQGPGLVFPTGNHCSHFKVGMGLNTSSLQRWSVPRTLWGRFDLVLTTVHGDGHNSGK